MKHKKIQKIKNRNTHPRPYFHVPVVWEPVVLVTVEECREKTKLCQICVLSHVLVYTKVSYQLLEPDASWQTNDEYDRNWSWVVIFC